MTTPQTIALLRISALNISLQRLQDRIATVKLLDGLDATASSKLTDTVALIETTQAKAIEALAAQAASE